MEGIYTSTLGVPEGFEIGQHYGAVFYVHRIQISNKDVFTRFVERNRNEQQEAFNAFLGALPRGANAVLGMQITSTAQDFTDGTFLYITFTGTAVKIIKS